MPRPAFDSVRAAPAATITTTTELVVVTSNGINTGAPGARVMIRAYLNVTTGLGTTGLTVRVRRGTGITGTVVGTAEILTAAASTQYLLALTAVDSPGEVAQQQYVVTVQQAGATGNGTANDGGIDTTAE